MRISPLRITAWGRWTSQEQSCLFLSTGARLEGQGPLWRRNCYTTHLVCLDDIVRPESTLLAHSKTCQATENRDHAQLSPSPRGYQHHRLHPPTQSMSLCERVTEGWCHHCLSFWVHQTTQQASFPLPKACFKGGSILLKHFQVTLAGL